MMMALIFLILIVCVMLIITMIEAFGIVIVIMMILMRIWMMMMITLTAHSVVSREENMWGILGLTPACPSLSLSLTLPPTFTFFQPVLHILLLFFWFLSINFMFCIPVCPSLSFSFQPIRHFPFL